MVDIENTLPALAICHSECNIHSIYFQHKIQSPAISFCRHTELNISAVYFHHKIQTPAISLCRHTELNISAAYFQHKIYLQQTPVTASLHFAVIRSLILAPFISYIKYKLLPFLFAVIRSVIFTSFIYYIKYKLPPFLFADIWSFILAPLFQT